MRSWESRRLCRKCPWCFLGVSSISRAMSVCFRRRTPVRGGLWWLCWSARIAVPGRPGGARQLSRPRSPATPEGMGSGRLLSRLRVESGPVAPLCAGTGGAAGSTDARRSRLPLLTPLLSRALPRNQRTDKIGRLRRVPHIVSKSYDYPPHLESGYTRPRGGVLDGAERVFAMRPEDRSPDIPHLRWCSPRMRIRGSHRPGQANPARSWAPWRRFDEEWRIPAPRDP